METAPTLGTFLWDAVRAGRSLAVVNEHGRVDSTALRAHADTVASRLREAGCLAGNRVVLTIDHKPSYIAALLGVLAVDATPVPLDVTSMSRDDINRVLRETGAAVLLTVPGREQPDPDWRPSGSVGLGDRSLDVVLPPEGAPTVCDPGCAMILYSSGATGHPKGVALSHESQIEAGRTLANAKREYFSKLSAPNALRLGRVAVSKARRVMAAARHSCWMTTLSLQGIAGHTVLVQAVLEDAPLVVMDRFSVEAALDLLAGQRVTTLVGTPRVIDLMARSPACDRSRFPTLLVVGLGAEPGGPDIIRRIRERFGAVVVSGYGSTELGGGVLATRVMDSSSVQEESVGFVFGDGDIRIVDDDGSPAGPGVVGELWFRTGRMMASYVDGSAPRVAEDGWFATGDLAMLGPDGEVRIVGRRGDVIMRDGRKFSCRAVEDVLRPHPGFTDVAVVGVQRPGRQHVDAVAFVVPADPGQPVSRPDVVALLDGQLPPFMWPVAVHVVEALPRGRDGKLAKRELLASVGAYS